MGGCYNAGTQFIEPPPLTATRAILFLCLLALGIAGCGQKGPLRLPDRETHGSLQLP